MHRDAGGAPPKPTRLQLEAQAVMAIDVECTHICTSPWTDAGGVRHGSRRLQLPAEVCLVDHTGAAVLRTFCNPLTEAHAGGWRHTSGVPPADWAAAPPLSAVRAQLAALIRGAPLVGHNLGKDLAVLQLTHPLPLQRDTMRYAALQGPGGQGRSLRELAAKKLGRKIQRLARHDPQEDAVAALDLYLRFAHFDPDLMGYDDLVEHYAAGLLGGGLGGG